MREELGKYFKKRARFTATFDRFGTRYYGGREIPTMLFLNIRKGDEVVTDHLWFVRGKKFEELNLKSGDTISFDARVTTYSRGFSGEYGFDYKLRNPTKIIKHLKPGEPGQLF